MKTKLMKARHWFFKWCKGHDTLVGWTIGLLIVTFFAVVVLYADEISKVVSMFWL